jgi:hypothetical protein
MKLTRRRLAKSRLRSIARAALLLATGLEGCGGSDTAPTTAFLPSPSPTATATPPPAPATLADLSAVVTSPQADRLINCREDVIARVSLTNSAASRVFVTGVRRSTRMPDGNCIPAGEYVHPYGAYVPPRQTIVVLNSALFTGGSGCCRPGDVCDGRGTCSVEESLFVVTDVGELFAGHIVYRLNFLDCGPCGQAATAGGRPCPPAAR